VGAFQLSWTVIRYAVVVAVGAINMPSTAVHRPLSVAIQCGGAEVKPGLQQESRQQ